jgi:mono/diheme cytochrome c family protein
MERRWVLLLAAMAVISLNAIVLAAFWPAPAPPPGASPAERLYLARCATCHGVRGDGSWRATLFLIRPGDLSNPRRMRALSDQYLFEITKQGGSPLGKPGMPGFGFHLSDAEIKDLVTYMRTLAAGRPPH